MAKRYDPIMCMMVDEPTKAQDAAYEIKEIGEPKYSIDKSKKFGLFVNGKLVARAVSKEAAEKVYETFYKKKAHDVAPATQRYINTIVGESKSNAEKFVRQAEQDDDVPENELKYVYKAYNDKFGYKFHDSASALDEAIKTADGATGDKLYTDVKAIYNLFSNILLTYTNEQSVQKLANEGTKKCLELAAKVKGVRDEAINTCDAVDDIYVRRSNEYYVNVKLGKSNPQISATISRILNKDKRVDGVLGSPGNWDVAIEGKDNAEYIKKILSGVGNIK